MKVLVAAIVNNVLRASLVIRIPLMAAKPVLVLKLIATLPRVVRFGKVRLVVFAVPATQENCVINAAQGFTVIRYFLL